MRHAALLVTLGLLLWFLRAQACHPLWYEHLAVDPGVYHTRAMSFSDNGSWSKIGTNEYQPGALWFFVAVSGLSRDPHDFDVFLNALFAVNLLLVAAHVALAAACGPPRAPWLMLLFAAACGPILLCRFELLVSLLVLGAWVFWRRRWYITAASLLGIATATKVYPVLLAPMIVACAWRERGWKMAASAAASWAGACLVVAGSYFLAGGRWHDFALSLRFHFDKPFGIDGTLGTLIPVAQWAAGIPLRMASRNGIHGFECELGGAVNFVAAWAAFAVVVAALAVLVRRRSVLAFAEAGALFVVIGLFIGAGKLMAPQYLWWAVPFVPLASEGWFTRRESVAVYACVALCLVFSQYIYPLHYSDLIACFEGGGIFSAPIFWINAAKNALWLAALAVGLRPFFRAETARAQAHPVSP